MSSRIRAKPDHLFECFLEIADQSPWWLQKFPENYQNEEILQSVVKFTFPCDISCTTVQHFSFVLTDIDSKWTFGFCRHTPNSQTALCILSYLPWHEVFYKILNTIAEITQRTQSSDPSQFLKELYILKVPYPGSEIALHVDGKLELKVTCPDDSPLPKIPDNRNLTEYYNAVDSLNMMVIFASMLNERRILITSSKLSRLSACVQAANSLIFPMHWQHIFIPVLPKHLIDYLSAPMPFLIGVPSPIFATVRRSELGEVVILHADRNKVETPFDDLQTMPSAIINTLRHSLKHPSALLNDAVAKAFLHSLVHLIGGYRDALRFRDGQRITFDQQAFITSRSAQMQPFLERMLHLQIFHQFIEERLEMLNAGRGLNDFFEIEVMNVDKNTKVKNQYKEWLTNTKKESGVFFKNVKSKMRDKSKKAYKEVKSIFQDLQQRDTEVPHSALESFPSQPRSAPSSPTSLSSSRPSRHSAVNGYKSYSVRERNSTVISYVRRKDGVRRSTLAHTSEYNKPYDLLQVDEVGCEAREQSDYDDESEEELRMRRLSLDLMDDLQDIIYKKRIASEDSLDQEEDKVSIPPPLPRKTGVLSCVEATLAPPIPPPRSRRRDNQTHSSNYSTNPYHSSQALQVKAEASSSTKDVPLIRLDSEEFVFDPLLDRSASVASAPDSLLLEDSLLGAAANESIYMPMGINSNSIVPPPSTASMRTNPVYFNYSSLHNGGLRQQFSANYCHPAPIPQQRPVYGNFSNNTNNNALVQTQVASASSSNLLRTPGTSDTRLYQSLPNSPVKTTIIPKDPALETNTGNVSRFCELFEAKKSEQLTPFQPFSNVSSTSTATCKGGWQTFD